MQHISLSAGTCDIFYRREADHVRLMHTILLVHYICSLHSRFLASQITCIRDGGVVLCYVEGVLAFAEDVFLFLVKWRGFSRYGDQQRMKLVVI
jgi:hypothetical protein